MKDWKLAYKITLINSGIVILIGLACALAYLEEFGITLGIVCLAGGLIDLFVGIIMYIAEQTGDKAWAKGFLNSGAILLLLSGISCGTGFANARF